MPHTEEREIAFKKCKKFFDSLTAELQLLGEPLEISNNHQLKSRHVVEATKYLFYALTSLNLKYHRECDQFPFILFEANIDLFNKGEIAACILISPQEVMGENVVRSSILEKILHKLYPDFKFSHDFLQQGDPLIDIKALAQNFYNALQDLRNIRDKNYDTLYFAKKKLEEVLEDAQEKFETEIANNIIADYQNTR